MLVEHGEMVTTRQIADAAGVAEGTIFRVFADKDELLSATLEAALDTDDLEQALEGIDPNAAFEDRLVQATDVLQRRVVDIWQVLSNLGPRLREQAARPITDSSGLIAIFEAGREELVLDPAGAARLLRAITLSMTHPMVAGEPFTAEEIVAFFLDGARGPR